MSRPRPGTKLGEMYQLWQLALDEPYGIEIAASNPSEFRIEMLRARRKSMDPRLEALEIRLSPWARSDVIIFRAKAAPHIPVRARPLSLAQMLDEE